MKAPFINHFEVWRHQALSFTSISPLQEAFRAPTEMCCNLPLFESIRSSGSIHRTTTRMGDRKRSAHTHSPPRWNFPLQEGILAVIAGGRKHLATKHYFPHRHICCRKRGCHAFPTSESALRRRSVCLHSHAPWDSTLEHAQTASVQRNLCPIYHNGPTITPVVARES